MFPNLIQIPSTSDVSALSIRGVALSIFNANVVNEVSFYHTVAFS